LLITPSTSAYAGTDPSLDGTPAAPWIPYSPIFDTMVSDGLIPDLFSLAILRDVSGPSGYLAFGGLPPVSFKGNFTNTPILLTQFDQGGQHFALPLFYTINIDSVLLHGKPLPGSGGPGVQYLLDSGTTLNYFPTSVANAFNAAFNPPAVYSPSEGVYYVDCKAKKPAFDIVIAGTNFNINPLDVILFFGTDTNGKDICISGVGDGGVDQSVYVLGDTFLKNVIAVFDVGAAQMAFAAREHYPSNDLY
jgi:Eukaryotic aspartyl protease